MTDKDTLAKNNEASKTDKRKQSLYFPESMLQEIKEEAARRGSIAFLGCAARVEAGADRHQKASECQ
ncbi:hypothetical protein WMF34_44240 [Sorangium sp. So ce145]